jgi:hypothetical protein
MLLDHVFGKVKSVSCLGKTHIGERVDEQGKPYKCTAEMRLMPLSNLIMELSRNSIHRGRFACAATICLRCRWMERKVLAVAGLRECYTQHYGNTPKPTWNPDIPQPIDFYAGWSKVPEQETFDNAFKVQWELFLKHVVKDTPFPWDLREGAKGVQLAEKGLESWEKRCWVEVPEL